jgi:hypothetical protein
MARTVIQIAADPAPSVRAGQGLARRLFRQSVLAPFDGSGPFWICEWPILPRMQT